jgi:ATP-dependent DNA ligase
MPLAKTATCGADRVRRLTDMNHLRHSKFIALRDDKPAKDVRRVRPVG